MLKRFLILGLCLLLTACAGTVSPEGAEEIPEVSEQASEISQLEPEPKRKEVQEESEAVSVAQEEEDVLPVFLNRELPLSVIERITGNSFNEYSPVGLSELAHVAVTYLDFDGEIQRGEMIVHRELGAEVREIFQEIYEAGFPVHSVALIEEHGTDDSLSMEANNSSAYCARLIAGTQSVSLHSYGIAVDINPVQNPYVTGSGVLPEEGVGYLDRENVRPGMITPGDACYNAFVSRGWSWGGDWDQPDYQHFEKRSILE